MNGKPQKNLNHHPAPQQQQQPFNHANNNNVQKSTPRLSHEQVLHITCVLYILLEAVEQIFSSEVLYKWWLTPKMPETI